MTEYTHESAAADENALGEEARVRARQIADSEQAATRAAAGPTSPTPDERIASVRRSGRHHDVSEAGRWLRPSPVARHRPAPVAGSRRDDHHGGWARPHAAVLAHPATSSPHVLPGPHLAADDPSSTSLITRCCDNQLNPPCDPRSEWTTHPAMPPPIATALSSAATASRDFIREPIE